MCTRAPPPAASSAPALALCVCAPLCCVRDAAARVTRPGARRYRARLHGRRALVVIADAHAPWARAWPWVPAVVGDGGDVASSRGAAVDL